MTGEIRGPLLEASALTRVHGRRGAALSGVSFAVGAGEVFGILGPSGSGKSTLARLLVALDRPTSGTVRFRGVDVFRTPAAEIRRLRPRFQLVMQDPLGSADPRWTARATIEEALRAGSGRVDLPAILGIARLDQSILDRRPHALSGGERQRVGLARALAVDPELVVLDEAFSALDTVTRREVLERLLGWGRSRGVTLVLIAHDRRLIATVASRALVLEKGQVRWVGPASDVVSVASGRPAGSPGEDPQVPQRGG